MFEDYEDISLPFHGVRLPEFKLEDEDRIKLGLKENCSSLETLKALCRIGFKDKILSDSNKSQKKDEYINRVRQELEVFESTKFSSYILIVWKVINFCKTNNYPVGPGRGSAPGSLVIYLLGISDVDPITYGLYFERFIAANRVKITEVNGIDYYAGGSLMDVDIDIADHVKPLVEQYLKSLYPNKCSKILTISTLQTRILIKEVGKIVGGYSEEFMNVITDSISTAFGKVKTIDLAAEESTRFKDFVDKNPLIIEIAKKLYEGPKSKGVHASAYLLSYDNLDEYIPTELDSEGELVSSFDMRDVSELALKLDLLGLKCVSIIDKVCKMVGIKVEDIDIHSYDDIYKYLQYLECPYGLFQISGASVVNALNSIKPSNFQELTDVISISRPGSFAFTDQYADFKNDHSLRPETHPFFDDILKKTNYICLYQEQLMSMFNKIGFSLDESNQIRKIVGKKLRKEIDEWEEKIFDVGNKNNIPKEACQFVWDIAKASADYSFNFSHGTSYGTLSAICTYLKFKYTKEFYLASLMVHGKEDIPLVERECKKLGVSILRPDIIKSKDDWSIEGENIRFGLGGIKGLNDKSLLKVRDFINTDTANKYQLFAAAKQAKVSILVLANIIHAGALNSLGDDRPRLVLEAQLWNILTDKEKAYALKHGDKYQYDLVAMLKDYLKWISEDGRKFKESRLETIRRDSANYIKEYQKNTKYAEWYKYTYEKKLLGYCYSTTLRDVFIKDNPRLKNIQEVKDLIDRSPVEIAATVTDIKQGKTKNGDKNYLKLFLSDETGEFSAMMLGEKLDNYLVKNKSPEIDDIVYLSGSKGADIVWINKLAVQNIEDL